MAHALATATTPRIHVLRSASSTSFMRSAASFWISGGKGMSSLAAFFDEAGPSVDLGLGPAFFRGSNESPLLGLAGSFGSPEAAGEPAVASGALVGLLADVPVSGVGSLSGRLQTP